MLTPLRNMLRSPAAGGIFVIVIIAMAAWGVTDIFAGGRGNQLVSSGDRVVSDALFDSTLERRLRVQTDEAGRSLTKEEAMDRGLVDELYQIMVYRTLLSAYADKQGISATTGAIAENIRTIPGFQDTTGNFDAERYSQILRNAGYRESDFETETEFDMNQIRIEKIPTEGVKIPLALARLQAAYSGELRSASWFFVDGSQLPEIGEPTEEDLLALYEASKTRLREPERRGISLIHLTVDDFVSESVVTEDDIIAQYDAYKGIRYTGPDTRTFTEFLFPNETIAEAALGRIAGGAAPESIETAISTIERTGRRELIGIDRLADQIFAPDAPVGTFGGARTPDERYMYIRLEGITPGDVTPLEDVRAELENELAREQAEGLFYDSLPRFDDLLGTGADLETIAQGIGTPVLSFAPVDANGSNQARNRYLPLVTAPGLLPMIFAQAEGRKTERFGEDKSTWLARVDSIVPERLPEFEEVRDDLVEGWKAQQRVEQFQNVAAEIEAAIASGESTLAQQADKYGSTVDSLPIPVTRDPRSAQLQTSLLRLIPGMFGVKNEGDTFAVGELNDQIRIVQVTSIVRPEDGTLDQLTQTGALEILNGITNDLSDAFLFEIGADIELDTNTSAFEAYKRSLVIEQ